MRCGLVKGVSNFNWCSRGLINQNLLAIINAPFYLPIVVRRFLTILLLLLLPLHSLAMQGGWSTAGHDHTIAHEMEHAQGTSHHHEDDGTVHYDESDESAAHVSEHAACQLAFTLPSIGTIGPLTLIPVIIAKAEPWQYIPDPIPERPQRPPSLSLG